MERQKLFLYAGLPLLIIVGAAGYHRVQRNQELAKQARLKTESAITVSMVNVENRPFRGTIPFTGTLVAVNRAELKAEVSGRVTRVQVQEGDRVSKGTVLCAQDEEDLLLGVQAAEAQLAQAQAQAQQAQRDNERAQMLLQKRSITKQAAQQAETYFNASTAGARAAESNLGLAKSRLHKAQIRSPFDGQVAQKLTQIGEMLAPGQPAFVVVDNRKLEILADLPTEAAMQVQVGMKAAFRAPGSGSDQAITGTVTQVAPSLLADGRTLRVRIEVGNADGRLKSGLFVEGEIQAQVVSQRPALPIRILTLQGKEADLFINEGGFARRKRVPVGLEQDGWRPVEGLAVGTGVVSQGRDQLVEGSRLNIVSATDAPKGK